MHAYDGNKNIRYANMQNGGHTFVRPRSFRRLSCIFYAISGVCCVYIYTQICAFEYVYTHITGFVVDTDFTSGDAMRFRGADARMRLIQYISGEMRAEGSDYKGRVEKVEEEQGGRWRAGGHTK